MFAVVKTGGKQYKFEVGKVTEIERLEISEGEEVSLDEVAMVVDGANVSLDQHSVVVQVVSHFRGEKVICFKRRRRTSESKKKIGHRQNLTRVLTKQIVKK
jgi:large subunit ribosomal protein L21